MAVDLGFVEFAEYVARKVLDPETEHPESGLPHGCQALGRHGVDAIGADELQLARQGAAVFGGNDRLAQRQNAPILCEYEDIILKDDRTHSRVCTDDALNHLYAFFRIEPRNARDASLGLVQEVRGRAESATHGAVVERDQAHRADLSKARLTGRLHRQGADAVRLFEPLPVQAVRHLFIGRAEDRVAQLGAVERPLRHSQAPAVSGALRGSGDPTQGRPGAQSRDQLEQRALTLPQHDAVEGSELEHELGSKGRLHATRNQQRLGRQTPREVRQLEIEPQRHAGGRDADDVPRTCQHLALEGARGWPCTTVWIEDLHFDPGGFEHARQAPHPQWRSEKGVLPAKGVVRPDQQDPRGACQVSRPPCLASRRVLEPSRRITRSSSGTMLADVLVNTTGKRLQRLLPQLLRDSWVLRNSRRSVFPIQRNTASLVPRG